VQPTLSYFATITVLELSQLYDLIILLFLIQILSPIKVLIYTRYLRKYLNQLDLNIFKDKLEEAKKGDKLSEKQVSEEDT
jgi:hypothetical protein